MKNLLIYINPAKKFNKENSILIKIQIDNALDLNWKKEDTLLVTNFKYEYNGVKSLVVDDDTFCSFKPRSTNTVIIPYLIEKGIIEKGKIYWVHDFDAYQLNIIKEDELGLDNVDIGLTDYGWKKKWCMGSFFFKESSKDLFEWTKNEVYKYEVEDEIAITRLTTNNINNVNERCKRLNITYNFGMREITSNYEKATKPLKVIHFHPYYPLVKTLDIFMYGKNELNKPIMTDRLIKIFKFHGIK